MLAIRLQRLGSSGLRSIPAHAPRLSRSDVLPVTITVRYCRYITVGTTTRGDGERQETARHGFLPRRRRASVTWAPGNKIKTQEPSMKGDADWQEYPATSVSHAENFKVLSAKMNWLCGPTPEDGEGAFQASGYWIMKTAAMAYEWKGRGQRPTFTMRDIDVIKRSRAAAWRQLRFAHPRRIWRRPRFTPTWRRPRFAHRRTAWERHEQVRVHLQMRVFAAWHNRFGSILFPNNKTFLPWLATAKLEDGTFLHDLDDVATMREAWKTIPEERRNKTWPVVMLGALLHRIDRASLVLEATLQPDLRPSYAPSYIIHDTLLLIARHLTSQRVKNLAEREKNLAERVATADQIIGLLGTVLNTCRDHNDFFVRSSVLFIPYLPSSHVAELWDMLQPFKRSLNEYSLVFASRLAADVRYKNKAFEILKLLPANHLNGYNSVKVITELLNGRKGGLGTDAEFSYEDALEKLMENGFKPNLINFTSFLGSICSHGHVEQALRLAALFPQTAEPLDQKAFNVVFRGAKLSLNADYVREALALSEVSQVESQNLLINALHCIYHFAVMESRQRGGAPPWVLPLFSPMLRIYAKQFELGPLQHWIPDIIPFLLMSQAPSAKFAGAQDEPWDFASSVVPVVTDFFSKERGKKLWPDAKTISLMLRAYVKSLDSTTDVIEYWHFLKERLKVNSENESPATKFVKEQTTLVHDNLILTLMERKGLATSQTALEILGQMLQSQREKPATDGLRLHPPPNDFTFHIILRGLFARGERMLGSEILEVMNEAGILKSLPTYNLILKYHAMNQETLEAVQTLQELESMGFKPDHYTYKAFGMLKHYKKAFRLLEGIIEKNRREFDIALRDLRV